MQTYIALLRGINVSGQKKIKMDELRHLLAEETAVVDIYEDMLEWHEALG